jgi:hypothetical protein
MALLSFVCYSNALRTSFSLSFPLETGIHEFRANLPRGRYAVVVSTNFSNKVFGIVPAQPESSANVSLEVKVSTVTILQETNIHYKTFSISGSVGRDAVFIVRVQKQRQAEQVLFNIARGF